MRSWSSLFSPGRVIPRDDRVLPEIRIASAMVILILLLAVRALYFQPEQGFAWTIKPSLTAMAMGAGYAMGAYFFLRAMTARYWHRVAAGFLPITAFCVLMALATLLHWDRFHQGQVSFVLWAIVYAVTPFLVPILWLRNQATDPQTLEPGDLAVPHAVRGAALLIGLGVTAAGVLFFAMPDLAMRIWPWQLTPLTARVLAGWMMLPGIGGLYLAREVRWSAWRVMVESVAVGSALFLLAATRVPGDLNSSVVSTAVFLAMVAFVLVLMPLLYLLLETRRRRATSTAKA
jgi:hypothetical protein